MYVHLLIEGVFGVRHRHNFSHITLNYFHIPKLLQVAEIAVSCLVRIPEMLNEINFTQNRIIQCTQ